MRAVIAMGLMLALTPLLAPSAAHAGPVSREEVGFDEFLALLDSQERVGSCAIDMEEESLLVITRGDGEAVSLSLADPAATGGRTSVHRVSETRAIEYRQSDFFGWIRLDLGMDTSDQIRSLRLYKTTPLGEVYDTAAVCE